MGVFHSIVIPSVLISANPDADQSILFVTSERFPGPGPAGDPLRARTRLRLRHLHVYFHSVLSHPDLAAYVHIFQGNASTVINSRLIDTRAVLPLDPKARATNAAFQRFEVVGRVTFSPTINPNWITAQHGQVVKKRHPLNASWNAADAPRFAHFTTTEQGICLSIRPTYVQPPNIIARVGGYMRFEETQL